MLSIACNIYSSYLDQINSKIGISHSIFVYIHIFQFKMCRACVARVLTFHVFMCVCVGVEHLLQHFQHFSDGNCFICGQNGRVAH